MTFESDIRVHEIELFMVVMKMNCPEKLSATLQVSLRKPEQRLQPNRMDTSSDYPACQIIFETGTAETQHLPPAMRA